MKIKNCIFCRNPWQDRELELCLCPDCIHALRLRPNRYEEVQLEQLIKLGDLKKNENLVDATKLMWEEVKKMRYGNV
jgi:hypothetical protein